VSHVQNKNSNNPKNLFCKPRNLSSMRKTCLRVYYVFSIMFLFIQCIHWISL
jgi:hypothetical protein